MSREMQKLLSPAMTVVVALWCTSCREDPSVCEMGETQTCVCGDGQMGSRTCLGEGLGWGECICGSSDGGADFKTNQDADVDLEGCGETGQACDMSTECPDDQVCVDHGCVCAFD